MTHKLLMATALLSLLLSGCGQTAPELDGSKNNISDAPDIGGDTVSIDENGYGSGSGGSGGSNGNYNSSSDGFRSIYFGFGDYTISSDMESNMNTNIKVATSAASKVKIEGNCDEFGTDEYNYALGLKRAKTVKDSLSAQGVNTSKMVLVSFGESSPVCSEPSDSCYDRNRRVDIRLVR
ncbi:OmpA family protein [Sulfurovum sp.]|uniref:OmpA family protein n=1 Tax=Sulfurovum sp. TaxID=1969726 RepID=UPI002867E280|nr:OmpA family protein [Sulfurovum sp.]